MTTAEKIQTWQELRDPNLRVQRLLTDRALAEAVIAMAKIEGAKGDKGDTPIKGKDYFTPEEIQAFIDYLRAQVKDGKDGKDGEKGATGSRGATGKDGYTPVRGVDYWTRQDIEELVAAVVGKLPKQSNKKEVVKPISYKDLTDAPDVSDLPKLVDFLKKGGFRGGGDTVSAGTGVTITRANGLTTISATGFTTLLPTETPDGNRTVFTFPSAAAKPSFIIIDGAWTQATAKSGTVNWTWNQGALQATLTIPPNDDVVGIV